MLKGYKTATGLLQDMQDKVRFALAPGRSNYKPMPKEVGDFPLHKLDDSMAEGQTCRIIEDWTNEYGIEEPSFDSDYDSFFVVLGGAIVRSLKESKDFVCVENRMFPR